jgi:hypothetical protein
VPILSKKNSFKHSREHSFGISKKNSDGCASYILFTIKLLSLGCIFTQNFWLANVLFSTVNGMEGCVIRPFLGTVSIGSAEIYEAKRRAFVFCVYVCACLTCQRYLSS